VLLRTPLEPTIEPSLLVYHFCYYLIRERRGNKDGNKKRSLKVNGRHSFPLRKQIAWEIL